MKKFPLLLLLRGDKPTRLLICDVEAPRQSCTDEPAGLVAAGLGGFLLPLKISVPHITIGENRANPKVTINGKDAACTTGLISISQHSNIMEIGNVFCNWLVVGNVVSHLTLSIDWEDDSGITFGGRYALRFIGTGNGAGSGIYTAMVQS